jgi:hypothetical protein
MSETQENTAGILPFCLLITVQSPYPSPNDQGKLGGQTLLINEGNASYIQAYIRLYLI